jgi:phosphatidylserine/phosphatidylglycerophosphate/cardiolipin synthase-like enzyme
VLADWQALFARIWQRYFETAIAVLPEVPAALPDGVPGRVAYSAALRAQDIRRALYRRVRGAERCVWLATAYFVPSRMLLRALKQAQDSGAITAADASVGRR